MSRQIRENFLAGSARNRYTLINTSSWGAHQVGGPQWHQIGRWNQSLHARDMSVVCELTDTEPVPMLM